MGNTVRVDIEGHESVSSAVDKAIAKLKQLESKDFNIDIDISTKEASAKIKELEAQIKALGDHTVHVKVDTGQARDKLTYLHARLQALGDKVIKIDVDTEKARDKIRYLYNRLDGLADKEINIDVNTKSARDKITYLYARLEGLQDQNVTIDADTKGARDKVSYLKKRLDSLTGASLDIDVDNAGALAKIAEVEAALSNLDDKTINIRVNDVATENIDRAFRDSGRRIGRDIEDVEKNYNDSTDRMSRRRVDMYNTTPDAIRNMERENMVIAKRLKADKDLTESQREYLDMCERIDAQAGDSRMMLSLPDDYYEDVTVDAERAEKAINKLTDAQEKNRSVNKKAKQEVMRYEVDTTALRNLNDESDAYVRLGNVIRRNGKIRSVFETTDDDGDGFIHNLRDINTELDRISNDAIKFNVETLYDDDGDAIKKFLRHGKQTAELDVEVNYDDHDFIEIARDLRSRDIEIDIDDHGRMSDFMRRLDDKTSKTINMELEARDFNGKLEHILREDGKIVKIIPDTDKMNRTLKDLGKDKVVRYKIERITDEDGNIRDLLHEGDRTIDIDLEVNDTAAIARIAAATRDRTVRTRMVVDTDNSLGGALGDGRSGNIITRLFGRGDDIDRDSNRISRGIGSLSRLFGSLGGTAASASSAFTSSIAGMVTRIPVLNGVFKALNGVTGQLAGMGGSIGKIAGPIGAVATAAVAAYLGLQIMSAVGVAGTTALTGGLWLTMAAMGAVSGAASALSAVVGGGLAAGFIYFASRAPEVGAAFDELGNHVTTSMEKISSVVAPSLVRSAGLMSTAFDIMRPSLNRMAQGTSVLVDQLSQKLPKVAAELGPALEKAFESGAKHLNVLGDALPGIVSGMGKFFEKLGSPAVVEAATSAWNALPGIIEGTGSALESVASGYNNLRDFFSSKDLAPLRDGWNDIKQTIGNMDWTEVIDGAKNAANSLGEFMSSIDGNNISDFISGIENGFASLTRAADLVNLDGFIGGIGTATEAFGSFIEGVSARAASVFAPTAAIWNWFKDGLTGSQTDAPEIEIPTKLADNDIQQEIERIKNQDIAPILIEYELKEKSKTDFQRDENGAPMTFPVVPEIEDGSFSSLLDALKQDTITVPVSPELNDPGVLQSSMDGLNVAFGAIPELKDLSSLQQIADAIRLEIPANPKLQNNASIQSLLDSIDAILRVKPDFEGGLGELQAQLMAQQLAVKARAELEDPASLTDALAALKNIIKVTPEIREVGSIQELLTGLKTVVGVTPEMRDVDKLNGALQNLRGNVNLEANIEDTLAQLNATKAKIDIEANPSGYAEIQAQIEALEGIVKLRPELNGDSSMQSALDALSAYIKVTPKVDDLESLTNLISTLEAIINLKPELNGGNLGDIQRLIESLGVNLPVSPTIDGPLPEMPPVEQPLIPQLPSGIPPVDVPGTIIPKLPGTTNIEVPITGKLDVEGITQSLQNVTPSIGVLPTITNGSQILNQLQDMQLQVEAGVEIKDTGSLLDTLNNLEATVKATPEMGNAAAIIAAIEAIRAILKPDVEPKFDGIMGKIPDLPAIDQPVKLKKDLSETQTALPPIVQEVIVRRKAEPSVAANLQTIETKTVRLIPDTSALQAIVVPPINVQLNVQSNAAQVQGLIAMIPLSITTQHTVQSNAAAVAGSIQQIPLSMNTQHTVSSNVADISNQVRSIPATMLTEHTTTTNTQATIDLVNSIPKSSQTDHTVNTNVDSALSRIRSLSGQNTSSTHTVNVVVNGGGGLPGGASISAFSGMAGAAASPMMGMMGAASQGSTLFGAAGATGGLSNNFKFSQKTGGSLLKVATIVKGGIVKAWEDVGSSGGKSFMEGLSESLDAISKIINEVVNIGNSIKDLMEALNPKPEGLENAAKDIADASKDIDKNLSNTADSVQNNAEKITNAAKFDPNIQGLQQIWGQVGQKIDTAFSTGISSAQNTIGTAFSEIQATLAKPFQTLPEINLDQIVKGDFSSVFAGIEQKKAEFTQAFESVKQTALNAVPGLNDAFNKVGQDIGAAFGWGVDESINSMRAKNPEIASVLDTFTANATGIQTAWQNAGTQIGTAFQTGVDQTKALVTSKIQEVKGIIDAPIAAQPQIDMPAVLGGNFDSVLAAINTKKTEFEQAFTGIGNVAATTGPQIQANWSQMGTSMGQSFTGALDQSKMLMQQAVDQAKMQLEMPQTFTPNVQALPQAMDQNLNSLVSSIEAKKPEVDAAMTQLTQGAAQAAPPTTSEHKINSNIAEVTAQINSLNGMVTTSTHMINVVTMGGGPGIAGIAGISGMAASPMGAMGLAGEGENGLMGAAGAGEMTSNFRYTNGSGGSLLQISNLVKDGIITAWEGLGEEVGKSFANGISNSQVLVVDKIGDIVGLAGKTITVKQLVDVQGEVIGSIVEVGDTVSSIADVTSSVGNLENVLGSVGNVISAVGGFGGALGILGPIGQIISSIGTLFGLFGGWFGQHKGGAFVSSGSLNESGQMVHYNTQQTVNNHFDGGLLGDPERQAKKVLDVLELAGSGRRANAVLGNGASV